MTVVPAQTYTTGMTNSNGAYEAYARQSRVFLRQAYEELGRADTRQASEKGWGAATQMVKAIAEQRGVDHGAHYLLHRMVRRLNEELDDDDVFDWFATAGHLHQNFYEGGYGERQVRNGLSQVSAFIEKLEPLLNGRNGASSS